MKKLIKAMSTLVVLTIILTACGERKVTQEAKDSAAAERQQSQYAKSQPVPAYDWSLERHLVAQLYDIRNMEATTHSVWRSDLGHVEGDCVSVGFGLPYDTSLTNPLQLQTRYMRRGAGSVIVEGVVEQAEPNGIFASKNTAATWVLCAGDNGAIDPIYVETKVTTYPYPVSVDYTTNRVKKAGKSNVSISKR